MSPNHIKAYYESIRLRYQKSLKKEKTKILDEFCATCDLNRKYTIRILNHGYAKTSKKRGRKPKRFELKSSCINKGGVCIHRTVCSQSRGLNAGSGRVPACGWLLRRGPEAKIAKQFLTGGQVPAPPKSS